jgi:magnesium-transporting ATPase (P-type)
MVVGPADRALARDQDATELKRSSAADVAWHALHIEEAFAAVSGRVEGLSGEEAQRRLARYGPNRLRQPDRRGPVSRFLLQFHNILIYVLLAAAVTTGLLGHWVDTGVIAGVVVINAAIGFIQEGKAEKALAAIRDMLSLQASVLRDGHRVVVAAEAVVPGDVVLLSPGDKVPADLRLFHVRGLQVQEAALTGESLPVEKSIRLFAAETPLGDRAGMAYAGTLVARGQASGLVVATGDRTEIGRIGAMVADVQTLTTPLLRKLAGFGRQLTVAILVVATATMAFGILVRGYTAAEMFMAAVGLAVAAIPEGLPAIMTIALAIGVQRMAERNAIVRRLPAVETLGSVTVICSDKTGTLTRNEMTVQSVATARHDFAVTGVGYDPAGAFVLDDAEVHPEDHPVLLEMIRAALLCNDAELRRADGGWIVDGDPMEGALLALAMKAGCDTDVERKSSPRSDVIPFESEHRFMATLHHDHAGHAFVYVKGAPERILGMCDRQRGHGGDDPLDPADWQERAEALAGRGQRVLAVACGAPAPKQRELGYADVEAGLSFLGLFGLIDPPRQEAIEAVGHCRAAGVRVKMITGDHAATARAIAAKLGLERTDRVVSGAELAGHDAAALAAAARSADVFARTSPEHKLRLVEALQAGGEVVAMTGDGVNDAPALKRADVGIAMGVKGTEAAKEAAEMVLADDNFASIARAVEEGRAVYDNLRKAIAFILPTNGGQAGTLVLAIILGLPLPITPVQILWVNMITAVTLALALAFEPMERDVMRRPPRRPDEPLLTGFLIWRIAFVSLIMLAGTFGLFLFERAAGASEALARTVAVNTLVAFEIFYVFNTRRLRAAVTDWEGFFGSRAVLVAVAAVIVFQLLFTYAPPLQRLFGTEPLDVATWLRILAVAVWVYVLVELEKAVARRLRARPRR